MFGKKRRNQEMIQEIRRRLAGITEHMIIRNIIYDSQISNPEEVARDLGLSPMSEELCDHEQDASNRRVVRFMPIFSLIDSHADMVGKVMASSYVISVTGAERDNLTENAVKAMEVTFGAVSRAAIISYLTIMDEMGILHRGYIDHE